MSDSMNQEAPVLQAGEEVTEVRVPAEYIRKGAQNKLEVYFEGGLKRGEDGVWKPIQEPRSTFYDMWAEKHLINKGELTGVWNEAHDK